MNDDLPKTCESEYLKSLEKKKTDSYFYYRKRRKRKKNRFCRINFAGFKPGPLTVNRRYIKRAHVLTTNSFFITNFISNSSLHFDGRPEKGNRSFPWLNKFCLSIAFFSIKLFSPQPPYHIGSQNKHSISYGSSTGHGNSHRESRTCSRVASEEPECHREHGLHSRFFRLPSLRPRNRNAPHSGALLSTISEMQFIRLRFVCSHNLFVWFVLFVNFYCWHDHAMYLTLFVRSALRCVDTFWLISRKADNWCFF